MPPVSFIYVRSITFTSVAYVSLMYLLCCNSLEVGVSCLQRHLVLFLISESMVAAAPPGSGALPSALCCLCQLCVALGDYGKTEMANT